MKSDRRQFIRELLHWGIATSALGVSFSPAILAQTIKQTPINKAIPASGELLPVIGMGTSRTFDIGADAAMLEQLAQVLSAFLDNGGSLIDSSPMYGNAEATVGKLTGNLKTSHKIFAATKVWTSGRQAGIDQMHASMRKMRVERFDLMQIHNLVDWQTHLKTLNAWKAEGKIRYTGITTSHGRDHDELETVLEQHKFDFVQLSYNIADREVENRLLPLAQDRGIAVLVNRPFQRGGLFGRTKGKPLPAWAAEIGCRTWGQFFLKYAVSHPAVTCAIPATSKPHHMLDNMGANFGTLPDSKMRSEMEAYFQRV